MNIIPKTINMYELSIKLFGKPSLIKNTYLYQQAFTHKKIEETISPKNCNTNYILNTNVSYERLEFLGDSILGFVVANYLYMRFPDQNEGFLSKIRTRIVNGKMLGFLAEKIGFNKFAIISKQVEEANGRNNYKIMEDIFEAFIGALYVDFQTIDDIVTLPAKIKLEPLTGAGYFIAEQWIIYIIENYLDISDLILQKTNYKDMLISYMQQTFQFTPKFNEINITNTKDNNKIFNYCVRDRTNTIIATAQGSSKKEAENNVSKEALIYYGQLQQS